MKILFLTRRFWPDIGGVENHVLEIGKRLVKNGYEVTVITQSKGRENEVDGIQIKRISKVPGNWFDKFYIWKWLLDNRGLIKSADIVQAHDVYFWYFPFRILYPHKKSFITFHGYENYPISKRAILIRKISEKLCKGNIIVGDFIKKWYGAKSNYVIYGGVNFPESQTEPKNKNSAVFIGRLDEQTGILEYAKTVDLIRRKRPKFEFAIIGDGKYKDKLKNYNPSGFRKNPQKYFQSYNFAFVSRYLSILEALVNKRLAFALFDNPVKEDYLKMSPFAKFIIIENSAEKLSEKVSYFLNHPKDEKEMIEKGFEWVKRENWDKTEKIYLKLWRIRSPS